MSDSFNEPVEPKKAAKCAVGRVLGEIVQKIGKKVDSADSAGTPPFSKVDATKINQSAFLTAMTATNYNITKSCAKAGVSRNIFYYWRDTDFEFVENLQHVVEATKDDAESALHKNIKSGSDTSIIFFLKTKAKDRGYNEKETSNAQTVQVLDDWAADTITTKEAAIRFAKLGLPLPEVLKIELSKQEPEPPPPAAPISEEELHAKYESAMANRDFQINKFKPARIQDVADLKESLKGTASFDHEKSD